jgi:hypothetical protein
MFVLCVVDVEEIRVQDRLNNTGDHGNGIPMVVNLCEVSPDPIGDVETSIGPECEQVMCRDALRLSRTLKHEQLRKNSN